MAQSSMKSLIQFGIGAITACTAISLRAARTRQCAGRAFGTVPSIQHLVVAVAKPAVGAVPSRIQQWLTSCMSGPEAPACSLTVITGMDEAAPHGMALPAWRSLLFDAVLRASQAAGLPPEVDATVLTTHEMSAAQCALQRANAVRITRPVHDSMWWKHLSEACPTIPITDWAVQGPHFESPQERSGYEIIHLDECAVGHSPLFNLIALGGTFDRLHSGHRKLLCAAMDVCAPGATMVVGITGDAMLRSKAHAAMIEPYDVRAAAVHDFVGGMRSDIHVRTAQLSDPGGPAVANTNLSALVVSSETLDGARWINARRAELDHDALTVCVVPRAEAGAHSSTARRAAAAARAAAAEKANELSGTPEA